MNHTRSTEGFEPDYVLLIARVAFEGGWTIKKLNIEYVRILTETFSQPLSKTRQGQKILNSRCTMEEIRYARYQLNRIK